MIFTRSCQVPSGNCFCAFQWFYYIGFSLFGSKYFLVSLMIFSSSQVMYACCLSGNGLISNTWKLFCCLSVTLSSDAIHCSQRNALCYFSPFTSLLRPDLWVRSWAGLESSSVPLVRMCVLPSSGGGLCVCPFGQAC